MQKKYDHCLIKGCGKVTDRKQYCDKHATLGQRRKLTSELGKLIRSSCCDAKCVSGKAHNMGEQYCKECKQPCCWKVPAASARRVD